MDNLHCFYHPKKCRPSCHSPQAIVISSHQCEAGKRSLKRSLKKLNRQTAVCYSFWCCSRFVVLTVEFVNFTHHSGLSHVKPYKKIPKCPYRWGNWLYHFRCCVYHYSSLLMVGKAHSWMLLQGNSNNLCYCHNYSCRLSDIKGSTNISILWFLYIIQKQKPLIIPTMTYQPSPALDYGFITCKIRDSPISICCAFSNYRFLVKEQDSDTATTVFPPRFPFSRFTSQCCLQTDYLNIATIHKPNNLHERSKQDCCIRNFYILCATFPSPVRFCICKDLTDT